MNTEEKLEYLREHIDDLNGKIIGLSAILASLIALHHDREALLRHAAQSREALAKMPTTSDAAPEELQAAVAMIDWITKGIQQRTG